MLVLSDLRNILILVVMAEIKRLNLKGSVLSWS